MSHSQQEIEGNLPKLEFKEPFLEEKKHQEAVLTAAHSLPPLSWDVALHGRGYSLGCGFFETLALSGLRAP